MDNNHYSPDLRAIQMQYWCPRCQIQLLNNRLTNEFGCSYETDYDNKCKKLIRGKCISQKSMINNPNKILVDKIDKKIKHLN